MNEEQAYIEAQERMEKRLEQNLMIPVKVFDVQIEAKPLGQNDTPIYCRIEGIDPARDKGGIISNGAYTFFIDDVSEGEGKFVKLYLFGSGIWDSVDPSEFNKDFFILC